MYYPLLIVCYGFSGDLMRRFGIDGLYRAYARLWKQLGFKPPVTFFAVAGSDIGDVKAFLETNATKFGVQRGEYWDEFIASWKFVRGRCTDPHATSTIAGAIASWLELNPTGRWTSYLSIQLEDAAHKNQNVATLECMRDYGPNLLRALRMMCLEKPAAKFEPDYRVISDLAAELGILDYVGCVDHYGLKEGAEFMLRSLHGDLEHLINPTTVYQTRQRIYEILGRGERGDLPSPAIDTMPHANVLQAMSRPPVKARTLRELLGSVQAHAVFNPNETLAVQQRSLQALSVGARYFYAQGESDPSGYYVAFTPVMGPWANIPSHWSFVKQSNRKLVEVEYRLRPNPTAGVLAETYTFIIETTVPGQGRSFGLRHETVRTTSSSPKRRVVRDEWTQPVHVDFGNGYGQVFWDVMRCDLSRMASLDAQCQGVCWNMALATWLEYHHKGAQEGIQYIRGTDPCPLIDVDATGNPGLAQLLVCGEL